MGYFITGLLCFIAGYIVSHVVSREKKKITTDNLKVVEIIKDNANKEMEKIKERLGKEVKEKDRDEIIKGIDDYFNTYYPDGYSG